jgi:thioredoxin-like negative regulator of GroEL
MLTVVLLAGVMVLREDRAAQADLLMRRDLDLLKAELAGALGMADARTADMVRSLDEGRTGELASLVRMTPRERLQRIFHPAKPMPYDALTHCLTTMSVKDAAALPADEAFEMIAPQEIRLPALARSQIYDVLTTNALTAGNADLAAVIIQHGFDMNRADLETLRRLVATFRQASRPVSAYRSTQEWLRLHGESLDSDQLEMAEQLEFGLAMESGHPDEALNTCLKSLKAFRDHEPLNESLLDRACQAALITPRSKEVLPFMKRFVAGLPEAKMQWWDLVKTAARSPDRVTRYREWVRRTADIADRNIIAEDAYFYHLRLAATGDVSYLDRFYPLANYLNRVEECMQVLQALPQQPDGVSIQVRLARLIAANGKPDHAMRLFNEWLRLHPTDNAVRLDLVSLMEETGDLAGAVQRLEEWLAGDPENHEARKKVAAFYLRSGQYEKALQRLNTLDDGAFDAELAAGYELAAGSLNAQASQLRALRLSLALGARASAETYLRMERLAGQAHGPEEALAVLRDGVLRMPTSAALRMRLALQCAGSGRYDEAMRELSHPVMIGHPDKDSMIALVTKGKQSIIAQTEIRKAQPAGTAAGVGNIP